MGRVKFGIDRPNDYELLYYIHQRDEIAWNLLQSSYRSQIERMIYRCTFPFYDDEICELRSECYHALSCAALEYRDDLQASFYTYVCKRLEHLIASKVRRNTQEKQLFYRNATSLDIAVNEKNTSYLSDFIPNNQWEYDGALLLQFKQSQIEKEAFLAKLQELERKIYKRHEEGYRYDEIAKMYHITKKKVDNTIQKIRKLRDLID